MWMHKELGFWWARPLCTVGKARKPVDPIAWRQCQRVFSVKMAEVVVPLTFLTVVLKTEKKCVFLSFPPSWKPDKILLYVCIMTIKDSFIHSVLILSMQSPKFAYYNIADELFWLVSLCWKHHDKLKSQKHFVSFVKCLKEEKRIIVSLWCCSKEEENMRTECILPIILIINIINIILLLLYVFQHRVNCSSGIYSVKY